MTHGTDTGVFHDVSPIGVHDGARLVQPDAVLVDGAGESPGVHVPDSDGVIHVPNPEAIRQETEMLNPTARLPPMKPFLAFVAGGYRSAGLAALSQICDAYWHPLYAFARKLGYAPADAQDLTQGFFESLIERPFLGRADATRREEMARVLGLSVGAVQVALTRARHRYAGLLRVVVLQTVASPAEVSGEIRHLRSVLRG